MAIKTNQQELKNIAFLTGNLMGWNGGVDFARHLILAISSALEGKKLNIYIFVENEARYKQFSGVKKIFFKLVEFFAGITLQKNHVSFEEFAGSNFVLYNKKDFKKALKKFKIDFMFLHMEPNYFDINVPSFGYLYDCQHRYYPEFFDEYTISHRDKLFQDMINSGKRIIVNSKSAKDDLIKFYDAKSENIVALPFTPKVKDEYLQDNSESIKKYNLPERYFLISNQFWIHKDHKTAFNAFAELIKNPEFNDVKLICTGLMQDNRRPEYINQLKQLIKDLDCEGKILCLGLIPKLEQIEIMKKASAVVQTTLFEGGPGGGCIWDSISLGVPSVVSDIPTNLEIEDKTVTFFQAQNVADLTQKMERVLKAKHNKPSDDELIKKSNENIKKLGNVLADLILSELP